MENDIRCFSEDHKDLKAISFYPECRIYMCNKCENIHSSFFKNHSPFKLNKKDEIFTGYCKEKNHPNKLDYYCKSHNKLCCGLCIAKLNGKGEGQHKDCDVCYVENIKEEKKNKLKESLKILEDLENKFNEIKPLKEIYQKIEQEKENLKIEIQNVFTKIRNAINNREDELLLEIDNVYKTKYFNEDVIKNVEKIPKQIKLLLDKCKFLEKEWDNKNNLISRINECINIENNIKNINIINENINKFKIEKNMKFKFYPKDKLIDKFIDTIKIFGKINLINYSFKECPIKIEKSRKYALSGNNNIMTKTGENGYMGTICENELDMSKEEHKWKIKFLKTKKNEILVGVAPIDFDINSSNHNCGWYFACDNLKLYSGPPFNYVGVKTNLSEVKDEIVVIMNTKKRTLKFIINDEDKGNSYENIPIDKPLFPAVILHDRDDSIQILELE